MLAVAENGGRIRPPVTIVKALASAITIGSGGSVGREGPIVQIGSALASTLGQWVRMSEHRLRIIVACGAAGGIAATFNAPITGLFFGFEIVLREFSLDALFTTSLAAVTGDVISRAFFGSAPFFTAVPHDLTITNDGTYLLVALLAIVAGLIGLGFKTVLYGMEDRADALWRGRPEWARPAVGGVVLGLLLLALPQMYGVGYPVMDSVIAGHVVVGLILLFLVGKIVAASLTLSIGGSGGVFAPSLFIGAMAGMAFGVAAHHLFGPAVGPPALYAVVAMGGVFAGAAQAPLTAIASVVEMTGNFTLTLPDHARLRHRRRPVQAALLRQRLHDQAAAARNRHRTPTARQRARDPQRRRRHATRADRQRIAPASSRAGPAPTFPDRARTSWSSWVPSSTPPATRRSCSRTKRWSRRCASSQCTGAPACPSCRATASTCAAGSPAATSSRRWRTISRPPAAASRPEPSPPISGPTTPSAPPTSPARRLTATRSSTSASRPAHPPPTVASTMSPGRQARSWWRSPTAGR